MRYLGGKCRTGKQIVSHLEAIRRPGQAWIEPFCGGLWVTYLVGGSRFASDGNRALIALYSAVQSGWTPPDFVSEDEYQRLKATQDPNDPLTAFAGIGCSFSGKWFGGYARSGDRNYAVNAKNSLLKKMARCADVIFHAADYKEVLSLAPKGSLIYLDPPYAGTTGYDGTGSFDSGQFWSVVRKVSEEHDVYISEYSAPPDFRCVLEMPTKTDMNTKGGKEPRIEKLFTFGG